MINAPINYAGQMIMVMIAVSTYVSPNSPIEYSWYKYLWSTETFEVTNSGIPEVRRAFRSRTSFIRPAGFGSSVNKNAQVFRNGKNKQTSTMNPRRATEPTCPRVSHLIACVLYTYVRPPWDVTSREGSSSVPASNHTSPTLSGLRTHSSTPQ